MENQISKLGYTQYECTNDRPYYLHRVQDLKMYKNHPYGIDTYSKLYLSQIAITSISTLEELKSPKFNQNIYVFELGSGRVIVCVIDFVDSERLVASYFNPEFEPETFLLNQIERAFLVEVISKSVRDYFKEAKALKYTDAPKILTLSEVRDLFNNASTEQQMTEAILLIEQTYRPYVHLDHDGSLELEIWLNTMLMGHLCNTGEYVEMVNEFNRAIEFEQVS
jgi:hypothetical protein